MPEKPTPKTDGPSEVVSANVPREIAQAIRDDAEADKRTISFIAAQILCAHYAKRAKGKKAA